MYNSIFAESDLNVDEFGTYIAQDSGNLAFSSLSQLAACIRVCRVRRPHTKTDNVMLMYGKQLVRRQEVQCLHALPINNF